MATRLSRVVELGYFMMDEERDAFLVRRLLIDHRPLLVGGVIPGGISLGPLFFYISAIPYALSRLNPIGPAYTAGVIGVIGVIATYVVGRELFSRRVGILAMIFSTFSLLNVVYHRPWWPLTMSQLVVLVTYLSLFRLADKTSKSHYLRNWNDRMCISILTIALIVGAQTDPSTLSLIPFSIVWFWWHRREIRLPRNRILQAIGIFLLAHATWLLFEIRHHFQNTRALFALLQGSHGAVEPLRAIGGVIRLTSSTIYRLFWMTGPLDITKQISPCEEFLTARIGGIWWFGAITGFALLIIYILFSFQSRKISRQLLSLHLVIALIGMSTYLSLFPGYVYEWLWSFLFPTFFLITADILGQISKKLSFRIFLNIIVLGWIFLNLFRFSQFTNSASLGSKLQIAARALREMNDVPYELRSEGTCFRYGGWRYIFGLFDRPPVRSYMDYVYDHWVYSTSGQQAEAIITVQNPNNRQPSFQIEPEGTD